MSENKVIVTPPPPGKLPDTKSGENKDATPEELKKGKGLKGWSLFFFIMSCIATGIIAASIALPFFLIIFGLISALLWILFIIVGTVFTLGMMWVPDSTKEFNHGWMAFNDKLFNSSETIINSVAAAIPAMAIVGGVVVAITWIFMIVGIATDKNRKKYYTAMLIVLGVLSLLYIIIAVISIIANKGNIVTPEV